MTNFEYYKEEILEITFHDEKFGFINNNVQACYQTKCNQCLFKDGDTGYCQKKLYQWLYEEHKEQPKLTKKERQFCELVETGWICRDSSDELWWFKYRPNKNGSKCWDNGGIMNYISNLPCKFSFIKWEDKEPWSVKELLKLEVEE